jgi:DNA-binding NarL/FixJ family response regulator
MNRETSKKNKAITVAIVEDDREVRQQFAAIIDWMPECTCVGQYANGENALEGLALRPARVVLMDINLPGMNGVECVRQIAVHSPETYVIMLTVHQDTDTIFEALSVGASGYLLKPVRKDDLVRGIIDVGKSSSPSESCLLPPTDLRRSLSVNVRSWICWPRATSTRKLVPNSRSAILRSPRLSSASIRNCT